MKTSLFRGTIQVLSSFIAVAVILASAEAATLSFSTTAPTPDGDDPSNFIGAALDRNNVGGDGTTDGTGNDFATYVAFDRAHQGQTFTTGAGPNNYRIDAVWLQHAGYSGNTDLTYYYLPVGGNFIVRVTDPSQAGGAGFALDVENYTTTGAEPDTLPTVFTNTPDGTGTWLRFAFDTPIQLAPSTQYGFDVSSPNANGGFNVNPFFETLGTTSDEYAGGESYYGSTIGAPDDDLNLPTTGGDRVFLVELTQVPEPSSLVLFCLGALALLLRCCPWGSIS